MAAENIKQTEDISDLVFKLTQLGAVARYEVVMQWRRRSLPVTIAGFLILTLLATIFSQGYREDQHAFGGGQDPDEIMYIILESGGESKRIAATVAEIRRVEYTTDAIMGLMMGFLLLLLAAPVMVAETIPRDQQLKVRHWMDGLPLSRVTYLAGKVLSVWTGLAFGLLLSLIVMSLAAQFILGAGMLDLGAYLTIWITTLTPALLFNTAAGVLVSATQPTRRRAILIAAACIPLYIMIFVIALNTFSQILVLANPIYAASRFAPPSGTNVVGSSVKLLGEMALALLSVGAGVWAWMRWRDGRQ